MSNVIDRPASSTYRVGHWEVLPAMGLLRREGGEARLTVQQMSLLRVLIANGKEVTSREMLFEAVWDGAAVEENSLARCISEVRRALGDDARKPSYIETLPKRGYRLIAPVEVLEPPVPSLPPIRSRSQVSSVFPTGIVVIGIAVLLILWWRLGPKFQQAGFEHRPTVAVVSLAPLRLDPTTDDLSFCLGEMLSTEVAGVEDLAVVPRAVISAVRHELSLSLDADRMGDTIDQIQRTLDLDFLIGGTFLVTAGDESQVRLDLRIRSRERTEPIQVLAESGSFARLPQVVAAAGRQLRLGLGVADLPSRGQASPGAQQATEVTALRKYVRALDALRSQESRAAVTLLEESLELRPDRSLTYLALSEAWSQLGYRRYAEKAGRQAAAHVSGSSPVYRLWLEAHLQELGNEWPEAVDSYRLLWSGRPENLESGLRLARAQIAAGDAMAAVETLALLRSKLPSLQTDPRLDLTEADARLQLGEFQLALEAADRAQERAFTAGAALVVGQARKQGALALYHLGEVGEARKRLERARGAFEQVEDHRRVAEAQSILAGWLLAEGDFARARALNTESLATFRRIGDFAGVAGQLQLLARSDQEMARPEEAESKILEAIDILHEIEDKAGEASAYNTRGILAARTDDLDQAEVHFSRALSLYRELGNRTQEGTLLVNLARVHTFRGEWSLAASILEDAEPLLVGSGNEQSLALLTTNLGIRHAITGRVLQAEPLLHRSVALYRGLENPRELANVLSVLGEMLVDRGDLTSAKNYLEESFRLRLELGEPARIANSRNALTLALVELGSLERATTLATGTLELEGIEENQVILAHHLLAQIYLKQQQLPKAQQAIQRAAHIVSESTTLRPSAISRALVPITQARIEIAQDDLAGARQRLESLMAKPEVQELLLIHAKARLALAEVEIAVGAREQAEQRLKRLVEQANVEGWSLLAAKAADLLRGHT